MKSKNAKIEKILTLISGVLFFLFLIYTIQSVRSLIQKTNMAFKGVPQTNVAAIKLSADELQKIVSEKMLTEPQNATNTGVN